MKENQLVGVITGDLINSSNLSEESKSNLKRLLEDRTKEEGVLLPIQFFRGDSFQLMCKPESTANLAVLIQALVISSANTFSRISVGVGAVAHIHAVDVLQSDGEAFVLSGHQLDKMKAGNRIFKIAVNNDKIQYNVEIATMLAENIMLDWKPGQASVISENPRSVTQKVIAEKLGISPAAVSKTLKACKWTAIEQYLIWFENLIKVWNHE